MFSCRLRLASLFFCIPGFVLLGSGTDASAQRYHIHTYTELDELPSNTVYDAVEVFEEARRQGNPFAVVFLDLTVPAGLGGRETAERLRQIDPEVAVIVASGYSSDSVMAEFQSCGFSAALSKPFGLEALSRVLESVL